MRPLNAFPSCVMSIHLGNEIELYDHTSWIARIHGAHILHRMPLRLRATPPCYTQHCCRKKTQHWREIAAFNGRYAQNQALRSPLSNVHTNESTSQLTIVHTTKSTGMRAKGSVAKKSRYDGLKSPTKATTRQEHLTVCCGCSERSMGSERLSVQNRIFCGHVLGYYMSRSYKDVKPSHNYL